MKIFINFIYNFFIRHTGGLLTLLPGNDKLIDIIGREETETGAGTGSGVRVCAVVVGTSGADSGILFHITLGCCRPE